MKRCRLELYFAYNNPVTVALRQFRASLASEHVSKGIQYCTVLKYCAVYFNTALNSLRDMFANQTMPEIVIQLLQIVIGRIKLYNVESIPCSTFLFCRWGSI